MLALTHRFALAVEYARLTHGGQLRKGTGIPYLAHLLAVAGLVVEHGGDEDQAIAGLLHDTLEDDSQPHAAQIRAQFGDAVAELVLACAGTAADKSASPSPEARRVAWQARKLNYLANLAHAPEPVLLVAACDKLHHARAVVADLDNAKVGAAVFKRFNSDCNGTLAYYQSLSEVFSQRHSPLAAPLEALVVRMHARAGVTVRLPLRML